jgi:hypothetical protein
LLSDKSDLAREWTGHCNIQSDMYYEVDEINTDVHSTLLTPKGADNKIELFYAA